MSFKYSRDLIYGEPNNDGAAPMWDRPSANDGLIFGPPVTTESPMWNRAPGNVPIFEEAVMSPAPMWNRPGINTPICPCCSSSNSAYCTRHGTPASSRPASSHMAVNTHDDKTLKNIHSTPNLKGNASPQSLGIKGSIKSLRRRASFV
ncbi:uncharacterized protein E0L32_007759 [Thyridium curvatum]|uniref:Uncharacterized protein n=1 Tax=Thyridium curvatum TaxID=1093900 RepID=A0A507B3T1_9PEZI|nr:uncharacterized protein E0L32_007759 [Thyridium curvatum]TPX11548.1 hypothetical protein E0L32_007759 [Thyridium curvatum]